MPWNPPCDNRQNRKRLKIIERDGDKCWLCGEPFSNKPGRKPSLDHVIPKSQGGTAKLDNMKLAHSRCNYKRGNMLMDLRKSPLIFAKNKEIDTRIS